MAKAKKAVEQVVETVAPDAEALVSDLDAALANGDVEQATETVVASTDGTPLPVQYAPYPSIGSVHIQALFPNKEENAVGGWQYGRHYGVAGNVAAAYSPEAGHVFWPMTSDVVLSQAGTEREYTPAMATVDENGNVVVTPLDVSVAPVTLDVTESEIAQVIKHVIVERPELRFDNIPWRKGQPPVEEEDYDDEEGDDEWV